MNLIAELAKHNHKITDITKIYHGLDNCCRCGCGGRYFEVGTSGFKRAIKEIQKDDFKPLENGTKVWAPAHKEYVESDGVCFGGNYLDIPYNKENDKCYCIYFD